MNIFQKIWVAYLQKPHSLWQLRTYSGKKPVKVVIGACYTFFPGWIHTDIDTLDILKEENWRKYFQPGTLDAMLAEHVWEHLTPEQGKQAFSNCFRYLKPGGFLRVAVPDGFHASPDYIEMVRPGGWGQGADDHKILYNYQLMSAVLKDIGFEVRLLEYHDEKNVFHQENWDPKDGMVNRSARFDKRNQEGKLVYTSLIIDAVKPAAGV